MATSNDSTAHESDVFSLFATSIWKVQLAPDGADRINAAIRSSLHELNPGPAELAPGESWQSDHQLHTRDDFGELVAGIMQSTGTILNFLKVAYEDIELTGCAQVD